VEKALAYCVVDTAGRVHIKDVKLAAKLKAKLVLAARLVANQLDDKIAANTTAEDVAASAGIPLNQSRARLSEIADEGFAEIVERGIYRARTFRVSTFLSELELP